MTGPAAKHIIELIAGTIHGRTPSRAQVRAESLEVDDEGTLAGPYIRCSMFFGANKRRPTRSSGRDSDRVERAADETIRSQARELRSWRESAQRVTRTWNAWLAAEVPERGGRYRAYEEALAEEERAAAQVERMLQLATAGPRAESDDGQG